MLKFKLSYSWTHVFVCSLMQPFDFEQWSCFSESQNWFTGRNGNFNRTLTRTLIILHFYPSDIWVYACIILQTSKLRYSLLTVLSHVSNTPQITGHVRRTSHFHRMKWLKVKADIWSEMTEASVQWRLILLWRKTPALLKGDF